MALLDALFAETPADVAEPEAFVSLCFAFDTAILTSLILEEICPSRISKFVSTSVILPFRSFLTSSIASSIFFPEWSTNVPFK